MDSNGQNNIQTIDFQPTMGDDSREVVYSEYKAKVMKNKEMFHRGDVRFTEQYIFPNQTEDGFKIIDLFYKNAGIRALSIIKRTKVGMDGLMIEIAKNMCTHPDPDFILHYENVLFITGMSNVAWENDMKAKMPACFADNVYHHGKLKCKKLKGILPTLKNALIIVDEIDTGDDIGHILASTLKEANLLDIENMREKNIRFVFVSATMKNQLSELKKWEDGSHVAYKMSIPETYVSHKDFLSKGIILESYPINDDESANKWIKEDIVDNYGTDYRIHIIRIDEKNIKYIRDATAKYNVAFRAHTSSDRIEHEELAILFNNPTQHIVLAIKGFFRRANLIPNQWKKKLGALHEQFTKSTDVNVQVQGLPGRMTGYWKKDVMVDNYKTGPYRTSIQAITEYENWFENPVEYHSKNYRINGSKSTFVSPEHIGGLESQHEEERDVTVKKCKTQLEAKEYFKKCIKTKPGQHGPRIKKPNEQGFYISSIRGITKIRECAEVYGERKWGLDDTTKCRYHACYADINDSDSVEFWVIHY